MKRLNFFKNHQLSPIEDAHILGGSVRVVQYRCGGDGKTYMRGVTYWSCGHVDTERWVPAPLS